MLKKIYVIFIYILVFPHIFYSQNIYQFEDKNLANFTSDHSTFKITDKYSIDGNYSLQWDFQPSSSITLTAPIAYKLWNSFSIFVYNEHPIDDKLIFNIKKNNIPQRHFTMNLNFKGWRTIWVNHSLDMKGIYSKGDTCITIKAPKSAGTLYFDQIILSIPINRTHATRDEQAPYINIQGDYAVNSHWISSYKYYHMLIKNLKQSMKPSTPQEQLDIKTISQRYYNEIVHEQFEVSHQDIDEFQTEYQNILLKQITQPYRYTAMSYIKKGIPHTYLRQYEFRNVGKFLKKIALAYHNTKNEIYKKQIAQIFIKILYHLYELGWSKGSGLGSTSHLGYQYREFSEAVFLMKETLKSHNELEPVLQKLLWYSNIGMIFTPLKQVVGINVDIMNTLSGTMLASILMLDNPDLQVTLLTQFSQYFSKGIEYAPGLLGGFKPDGSGFHHRMHYPAYVIDAVSAFSKYMYLISKTSFAISKKSHSIIKKYLLMSRLAANTTNILLFTSGRHPTGLLSLKEKPFRYFALMGSPNQEKLIDPEIASAYLRLFPQGDIANQLKTKGFKAETAPHGSWTQNWASLQLHRQKEWLVGARGFSRYLVGTEIYKANNRYGRYLPYGQFQFLLDNSSNSGFVQEGYSWSHFPGTTALNTPIDSLEASVAGTEMLVQIESFSGGNSLKNSGLFAMKLKENKRYDGSHHARKSIFFLDDRIVFLGSNIENTNHLYDTHTTILQNYLGKKKGTSPIISNQYTIIKDSVGNIYIISNDYQNLVTYKQGMQYSRDEAQKTITSNNFEIAYINHKKSPKNSTYHYTLLVQGNNTTLAKYLENPQYKIIQWDYHAHILEDFRNHMRHYVLFEQFSYQHDPYLNFVSEPSTLIINPENSHLTISFVNPDLAFYKGIPDEEPKIYDVPWGNAQPIPIHNFLIFRGLWTSTNKNIKIHTKKDQTFVEITSIGGTPKRFMLFPQKN